MKELSEELKNIAWGAYRSAPGRVPSVEAACLAVGNAMVEQDREEGSLSESQWAEVEKAMYAQGNTSGGWPQYIAGVRARLLPPKTPPTLEERVTTVSLGDGIWFADQ